MMTINNCLFPIITFSPLSLFLEMVCFAGQEQRWEVEPQGPEEAALQEDASGALCDTIFSVSQKESPPAANATGLLRGF